MKKLALLAAAGMAVMASPAYADTNDNFVGPRIGVSAGIDDVTNSPDLNDVVYGVDAGIDAPVGDRFTVGVEAFSTNLLEDTRTIGVAGRLGYAVTEDALVFARGGYANYRDAFNQDLDGLTVGGGLEYAINSNVYTRVEYRYSDLDQNVGSHGALLGVGLRF